MDSLETVAPAFVSMAHRIVWATVATVDAQGRPWTRVLHPVWEWDGRALTGWIATSPQSPKRAHLDRNPVVSLTYWTPEHDTCTANADARWVADDERGALWDRLVDAPPPVGYDPSIIPAWTSPTAPAFGGIVLSPTWVRVATARAMVGEDRILQWRPGTT